jgi:hypothetical protein
MSKLVTSPVTKFPGTVTLKDPIPLSACVDWETALAECQPSPCHEGRKILMQMVGAEERESIVTEYTKHFAGCANCKPGLSEVAAQERMIKTIKSCVESWNVPGFDLANPPGSPKKARSQFVGWIIGEISAIYNAEDPDGDPNA